MQGSLALGRGALFVGDHAKTARVRAFDLGGRELGPAFSFRDVIVGRSSVSGLAVDEDHTILIADTPAHRVRRFSLFGREVGGLGTASIPHDPGAPLLPGFVRSPVGVVTRGHRDQGWIAIACGGVHRHAVQLFDPEFGYRRSYASFGEPSRPFQGVSRIAADGERLFVAEAISRTVQVFRSGEFSFAFRLVGHDGQPLEPSALAPTGDGRLIVGCRSPRSVLLLVDSAGRPLRELAGEGEREGAVAEPSDAVIVPASEDRLARIYVLDRDGLRVQVFTHDARCLGTIRLDGSLSGSRSRTPREEKGGR